ncbi:hypothetical protein G6F31_020982 [Rhizopus arrhizus]|nr:hypothetical protein G6F31_020982 [Rhizopus arrhizus]
MSSRVSTVMVLGMAVSPCGMRAVEADTVTRASEVGVAAAGARAGALAFAGAGAAAALTTKTPGERSCRARPCPANRRCRASRGV